MQQLLTALTVLCAVFALSGCSTKRIEAPEPNMNRLIVVNKTIPADLKGRPEIVEPDKNQNGSNK